MVKLWILSALALCVPTHSFSQPPACVVGNGAPSFKTRCRASGDGENGENGGTAWIKKAMGSDGSGGTNDGPHPSSSSSPDFTPDEILEMERLIVTLSYVSDDEKRRAKLADILDKQLNSSPESDGNAFEPEVPRFAKLFQLSLDNVGEAVQTAAREKALQIQQQNEASSDSSGNEEEGEIVERVKTKEELQLWALIDMMVQSKTRVKLHMGSLGSQGEFR